MLCLMQGQSCARAMRVSASLERSCFGSRVKRGEGNARALREVAPMSVVLWSPYKAQSPGTFH